MEKFLQRDPIKKILVVDDEEIIRELFKAVLEKFGYQVAVASNGNEGVKYFRANPADLVITDMFTPGKNGHAFIREILNDFPETKFLVISGDKLESERKLNAKETFGAVKVFAKPIKIDDLLPAIREASA